VVKVVLLRRGRHILPDDTAASARSSDVGLDRFTGEGERVVSRRSSLLCPAGLTGSSLGTGRRGDEQVAVGGALLFPPEEGARRPRSLGPGEARPLVDKQIGLSETASQRENSG